jgi:uncharacterized protein YndB with AHSA1/START domain
MTVVSATPDTDALTLTIVTELAAPPTRVWQLWSDPRQLERWWGPPTYPATFEQHEFVPGGAARYFMTGPEGDTSRGWWRFLAVDEPHSIELEDGFDEETGERDDFGAMRMKIDITEVPAGSRMTVTTTFTDADQMKKMVEMGMLEGMSLAMGQIDGILAGQPAG